MRAGLILEYLDQVEDCVVISNKPQAIVHWVECEDDIKDTLIDIATRRGISTIQELEATIDMVICDQEYDMAENYIVDEDLPV